MSLSTKQYIVVTDIVMKCNIVLIFVKCSYYFLLKLVKLICFYEFNKRTSLGNALTSHTLKEHLEVFIIDFYLGGNS